MYKRYRKGVFCVVYSTKPLKFLLLHRKKHWQGWEFPKGGRIAKEKLINIVKREVKEETNLDAKNIRKFNVKGKFLYDKITQREWKAKGFSFILFSCEVKKNKVKFGEEHDDYKWCSYKKALKLLSFKEKKYCLRKVYSYLKLISRK